MDKEYLVTAIKAMGLSSGNEKLVMESIVPAIKVITEQSDAVRTQLGASKMGTNPDLPKSINWPTWTVPDDHYSFAGQFPITTGKRLLDCIAQINLNEINHFAGAEVLPSSGFLYFFYDMDALPGGFDPKERDSFRVIYYNGPTADLSLNFEKSAGTYPLAPCKVTYEQIWLTSMQLEFENEDKEAYITFLENYSPSGQHQLLGRPYVIQNPMELECQLVSNGVYCGGPEGYVKENVDKWGAGVDDWRLLFQVDSDENMNVVWGDVGIVYFWIRKQDLANKNFENIWTIMQCC